MLVFFSLYIFCSFATFSILLLLITYDFVVYVCAPYSQKGKNNYFAFFSTFCKKHLLTVAMATARSPIKMPCENEDLPDKENAPDFDEDTLQGELCSTSASVIVETISISSVSRM